MTDIYARAGDGIMRKFADIGEKDGKRVHAEVVAVEGGISGGSTPGGSTVIIDPDGDPVHLPHEIEIEDDTPQVWNLSLLTPVRSVKLIPEGDAELTLEYRFGPSDAWEIDVVVTAASPLVLRERFLDAPVHSIRITRTGGTSTLSTVEIA